jgi:uncharacterized protein YndB with AHSA1/START domain
MSMDSSSTAAPRSTPREVVVARTFDAPRDLVFRAWTEPRRLMRWFAPRGATTAQCSVDLRPGGHFRYCMRMEDGKEFWGLGVYREVVAPERLVYVDSFADPEGNPVPPTDYGMSDAHPREALVTVTFAEDGGRTTVTVRHEVEEGVPEREGMVQGWTEMLERLEADLAGGEEGR